MRSCPWVFLSLMLALSCWRSGSTATGPAKEPQHGLRRPVALQLDRDERWLYVANQRSGSLSVIDLTLGKAVAEHAVGKRVSDLAAVPGGRMLLAVDEAAGGLLVLRAAPPRIEVAHRLAVPAYPASVLTSADGKRAYVASLWSRQVTVIDLSSQTSDRAQSPRVLRALDLPFAPRMQILVDAGSKLIVADSFSGRLAVIDSERGQIVAHHDVPGHNIRGLTLSPDGKSLIASHQILLSRATTSRDDIHWGNLITNNVRILALGRLLEPRGEVLKDSRLYYAGDVGRGAADASGIAVTKDGLVVVALAGVNEVALLSLPRFEWQRFGVGQRPTAVRLSPDESRAYVANTFSDSISIVNLKTRKVEKEISLGPMRPLTASERGEVLFHSGRLSHDGWLSCQSCHTDGHSNGQLNDNLSDGSYGTPKRVLSLLGVRDTGPWAWNAGMPSLEKQVESSILTTMRGPKPTPAEVNDLVEYIRTLEPAPARQRKPDDAIERGREVFQKSGCASCHAPPMYTSPRTHEVWGKDERAYNPPSLRGVSQGGPYFHDSRAATLEEVFTRHGHQISQPLEKSDFDDLLAFLRSI